jgi:hypothetical protein
MRCIDAIKHKLSTGNTFGYRFYVWHLGAGQLVVQ